MIRDYIGGQHERYLAPFTALLVFYSVFTLLVAVVHPESSKRSFGDELIEALDGNTIEEELSTDIVINGKPFQIDSLENRSQVERFAKSIIKTLAQSVALTHLDQYPEAVDKPWIGDARRAIEAEDIPRACRMETAGSLLALAVFSLARLALITLTGG